LLSLVNATLRCELCTLSLHDALPIYIGVNISLIRKRLRSEDLACETYFKGSLTETKLVLMYMENIANDEIIKSIKERIDKIDVEDRKSTRLNSSHVKISYAVFCLKKK